jgi:hypothetical protein
MENLLANVSMVQHMGIMGSAMRPDLQFPMVATRDIAAKAAELLNGPALAGHSVHYLLGPRNYSQQDATAAIGQAIGQAIGRPELPYVAFSYEDAKKGMVGDGLSESMASLYDEMTRNMNDEKVMVSAPRDAASTTRTTVEMFAQSVFAPVFKAATAGAQGCRRNETEPGMLSLSKHARLFPCTRLSLAHPLLLPHAATSSPRPRPGPAPGHPARPVWHPR